MTCTNCERLEKQIAALEKRLSEPAGEVGELEWEAQKARTNLILNHVQDPDRCRDDNIRLQTAIRALASEEGKK